jgi:hypothetical protein
MVRYGIEPPSSSADKRPWRRRFTAVSSSPARLEDAIALFDRFGVAREGKSRPGAEIDLKESK